MFSLLSFRRGSKSSHRKSIRKSGKSSCVCGTCTRQEVENPWFLTFKPAEAENIAMQHITETTHHLVQVEDDYLKALASLDKAACQLMQYRAYLRQSGEEANLSAAAETIFSTRKPGSLPSSDIQGSSASASSSSSSSSSSSVYPTARTSSASF
ncbi:hypothetical protein NMY22_g16942 [Coprinellus aureogranulatus]|nr:hypothetical protein NMY22_g16942 [Coprinellus aureogranulatus]